ncbi:unnamed protein product [Phytomonas sp. Hart1]|nr:unnamed protein product [Phytomonas sp. Hart1]|eukprot:CCW68576.1 unnamed protein product [Phytomonas sp. isolate Hart1]
MQIINEVDSHMIENMNYDDESEKAVLPFEGIDKTSTLQLCRVFNAMPLDIGACEEAVTQMLYLIYTGTTLTEDEATDLFFLATRLFQSDHPTLRRLHYVLMKELSPLVERSYIASNSIMLDVKNSSGGAKSNALRTLYAVMDHDMYPSMERTILECITSQAPVVVMAALVTGIHISSCNPEMPRKWATQLMEVMKGRTKAQYPCIALQHKLRRGDKLSVGRLVDQVKSGQIQSPFAICSVIKMCVELASEDFDNAVPDIYNFFKGILQSSSNDMLVFEASKAICSISNLTSKSLAPVVMVLQLYLSSQIPIMRFAAIRQLNAIAIRFPEVVTPMNSEIEVLMLDPNRIIATLAITSLLKTGTEETVDHLVEKLSPQDYINELGDEFAIVIVDAMRILNKKYPSKYMLFLSFLLKFLVSDGSKELKDKVLNSMIEVAMVNPEAKDPVMKHLVEFIDDCEYANFTKRVLTYLGNEIPSSKNPSKFVRYICNHITLDAPDIRIVAVSTLAKIGACVPSLRSSILAQLRKLSDDSDDEVRDRAMLYSKLFTLNDAAIINTCITDIANAVAASGRDRQLLNGLAMQPSNEKGGEKSLGLSGPMLMADAASGVPPEDTKGAPHGDASTGCTLAAIVRGRDELRRVKRLRDLGEPVQSTEPVTLTDPDNEYVVTAMKHVYTGHLVLQFAIANTMEEMSFTKVNVCADTADLEEAEQLYSIPVEEIRPGETRYSYIVLEYAPQNFPSGHVDCVLQFAIVEDSVDDDTSPDEYNIEGFDVLLKDFVLPATEINSENDMEDAWKREEGNETAQTYAIPSAQNLSEAAQMFAEFYGMHLIGEVPERIKSNFHIMLMAGRVVDEQRTLLLVRMRVFVTSEMKIALQLALRGGDEELRQYFTDALLA